MEPLIRYRAGKKDNQKGTALPNFFVDHSSNEVVIIDCMDIVDRLVVLRKIDR